MLLAYLRGLLTPDYPEGIRSILRERAIVTAIGMEKDADYLLNIHKINVDRLVPDASQTYKDKLRRINHGLRQVKELYEGHLIELPEQNSSSLDDIVKLHHALKEKGIITG
jgi:hypothetical protein